MERTFVYNRVQLLGANVAFLQPGETGKQVIFVHINQACAAPATVSDFKVYTMPLS
jgi:hypothetical protein